MEQLLRTGAPTEIGEACLLIAGLAFILTTPFVWIFGKTIALREKPDRRALWTTALAYAGSTIFLIVGGGTFISPWLAPIAPLPAAALIFLWLRHEYRKGWIDDDNIPDGTKLENSDWRVGVGVVISIIVAGAIKMIFIRAAVR